MELKVLSNDNVLEFLPLVVEMYKEMDSSINQVGAIGTVMLDLLNKNDFTAIGLYIDGVLSGIVLGYYFENKTFYFSGIYVMIKNKIYTKELIEYSFEHIREKGYSAWLADATNGNISSILEKYGAKKQYTRYHKEF